uniref:Protein arginine N-methyltransferase domain-containing protein n=1 Tax=Chrysotila carterae TaxID=13221 RepID=A0A7S4FBJ5_CHRCT
MADGNGRTHSTADSNGTAGASEAKRSAPCSPPVDTAKRAKKSDGYFESYAYVGIHEEMLRCRRTDAYLAAIAKSSDVLRGKAVLDVGAGTGVLAIACAKAGARVVYAVEAGEMATHAATIVDANGFSDVVKVMHAKVEEVQLPEKVDVIVSEWMGIFLVYEAMLDSVLIARDRWLKHDGHMLPRRARLWLCPLRDTRLWEERVGFWTNVHGLDMSCLQPIAAAELCAQPRIEEVAAEDMAGTHACIADFDLGSMRLDEARRISSRFECTSHVRSPILGFVSYFDVEIAPGAWLSTSPEQELTHWQQVSFLWDSPLQIGQGDVLRGSVDIRQQEENKRCLDVLLACRHYGADGESSTIAKSGSCRNRSYKLDTIT